MDRPEFERALNKLDFSAPKDNNYEFISFRVPKETKAFLDTVKDSESMQDLIIKRHIQFNMSAVEEEIKSLDEVSIYYKGFYIKLKDSLAKIQEMYSEQIDASFDLIRDKKTELASVVLEPFTKELDAFSEKVKTIIGSVQAMDKQVSTIADTVSKLHSSYSLERIIEVANKWENLGSEAKKLLAPLFVEKEKEKEQ